MYSISYAWDLEIYKKKWKQQLHVPSHQIHYLPTITLPPLRVINDYTS